MATETIATLILLGTFFVLIFLGNHILFSIGISTALTLLYLQVPLQTVAQQAVKGLNSFSLMAVPFFIFMGDIMAAGKITDKLVNLANALVGWMRGGMAMVNVLGSMFFGGISGSPTADVASLGPIELEMMDRSGYDKDFSTGLTMSSAIQGLLIPPSHNMVIYCMAAGGVSVGQMFMGGLIPGVVLGITLMVYSYIVAMKRGYPKGDRFSGKEALKAFLDGIWGTMTILIVVVGVVAGVFTATESAAIACVYSLIVVLFVYRTVRFRDLPGILKKSLKTLAIVMGLIGVSSAFGWVVSYLRIPVKLTNFLLSISHSKVVLLLLINILLLIMGALMDMICSILIITPIILPVVAAVGVTPLQLGVIMIFNLGIGLMTPPFGVLLYVCRAISGRSVEQLTKASIPFYIVLITALLLITFVPGFSTFLPGLLYS
ncbi:MAG: TRAP transporter large permease [Oscillospiraceae bacterium]|nr:TRAP transporter large permease [Oscillospiraceae bacterium]